MAEMDRILMNHYNLKTLYPAQWPEEKDQEDTSDEEAAPAFNNTIRRSKSRYSALERTTSRHSSILGAQKTKDGQDNLVQRDEPDPLGGAASVVQILRSRGLPVEDDLKLRNRFLLSSTTFSPTLFLSQVHNNASTESLLQGLDFLSRSIEKKSASLKILVESNFERFVRAKATIDSVYTEMRNQGMEPEVEKRPHSRHASKSGHLRHGSNMLSPVSTTNKPLPTNKKKNALIKESEYGVLGIKGPLTEAAAKAEEVWGSALGGKEKEETLKASLSSVERNRSIFEVGSALQDAITRKDYDAVVEEYNRARRFAVDAKTTATHAVQAQHQLTDSQIYQILVTARMWADVDEQTQQFKRDMWSKLSGIHIVKHNQPGDRRPEEHMELIRVLLEIGVDDNPIWVWLLSRYDYLKKKITATSERSRVETEILRRRLASSDKPSSKVLEIHLRAASNPASKEDPSSLDTPRVVEFWEHVQASMTALLSMEKGVLGEVVEFWDTAQSFISGKAQRMLPSGPDGTSKKHHRLSVDGVNDLQNGAKDLFNLIRESVFSFFADPPIEDISLLMSPIPPTPTTPKSATLSPLKDTKFSFDPHNIPPPSPKRGEAWEKYAFWPPYANCLSGVHFLASILALVGTAAGEMAGLEIMRQSHMVDQLKHFVGGTRERCVQAVCAAWNDNADHCKLLEDWTRSTDKRDITNTPTRFSSFELFVLLGLQKILYISEAATNSSSADVVVPPSTKLLQMVRSQFVTTLYKAFSGMVENAERYTRSEDIYSDDADGLIEPAKTGLTVVGIVTADASNKKVRMLLTLNNLQALRSDIVPQIISQFEFIFSIKLTDESKSIRDVLGQIDARLFQSYVKPTVERLTATISAGIASPDWPPSTNRPTDARPYVYEVLLSLVLVHTEITTVANSLCQQVLSYMLEQLTIALIEAFKRRSRYSLPALMQATLDVEFIAQTLNNYTTEKASETQNKIYLALDERTDNEARTKMQNELPQMRAILKRLRESTKGEFACFKRQRAHRKEERPSS